jgi:hypothetical protein
MKPIEIPKAEWRARLAGTELEAAIVFLPEGTRVVIVVDDAGKTVACWATMTYRHVEGLWLAPDHRRGSKAFALLADGMRELLQADNERVVLTVANDDVVAGMLEGRGATALPGTQYVLPVERITCRPSSR